VFAIDIETCRSCGRQLRVIAIPVTARATVPGRAGSGSGRATPAFPGERGRFVWPNDEGSGRLRWHGGLDLPSTVRFQAAATGFAADIMAPYTYYPRFNIRRLFRRWKLVPDFASPGSFRV